MDDAFLVVVIGVSLLALVGAVVALATSGSSYDHIGRGGISPGEGRSESAADREAEVRQMLAARDARRAARGQAPADTGAEPGVPEAAADPELVAEVRALLESRNARRIARGEAALDIDAEVSRRLRGM